jgi:hypothetical protein
MCPRPILVQVCERGAPYFFRDDETGACNESATVILGIGNVCAYQLLNSTIRPTPDRCICPRGEENPKSAPRRANARGGRQAQRVEGPYFSSSIILGDCFEKRTLRQLVEDALAASPFWRKSHTKRGDSQDGGGWLSDVALSRRARSKGRNECFFYGR